MTTPINSATLEQLAAAIATAIQKSGGGSRGYNPISNQVAKDGESPAQRAEAIRTFKISQNNNLITQELVRQQASATKSVNELERMMELNNKTLSRAINAYEDVEDVQRELVKNLKDQIIASNITAAEMQSLGGDIRDLEGALQFADMAKATAELSKAIKETGAGSPAADKMLDVLAAMKAQSVNNTLGANFQYLKDEITQAFKDNHAQFDEATKRAKKLNGTDFTDAEHEQVMKDVNKQLEQQIKSGRLHVVAKDIETLATKAQTAAINAHINTTQKLDTIFKVAGKRIEDWTVRVAAAGNVIDKLGAAVVYLYKGMQMAAATGTQRTVTEFMGRETRALFNGVSVDAVQEVQTKNAHNRSAMGRDKYDDAMYQGAKDLWRITGNKDTAMKEMGTSVNNMSKVGVGQDQAVKATTALISTFNELQYITGMTVGEINSMNAELTQNEEFRQSLNGLDQKERAEAIRNIDLMVKENALRGISVEQSKRMIDAQKELSAPFSPKTRMVNAAKIRAAGGAMGADVGLFADFTAAGGEGNYRKRLKEQNFSDEEINEKVKKATLQRETFANQIGNNLNGPNQGLALMTEGIGNATQLNPLFKSDRLQTTTAPANAVTGEAQKGYLANKDENIAGNVMAAASWAGNLKSNALAVAGGAAMMYANKRFGVLGKAGKMAMANPTIGPKLAGAGTRILGMLGLGTAATGIGAAGAAATGIGAAGAAATGIGAAGAAATGIGAAGAAGAAATGIGAAGATAAGVGAAATGIGAAGAAGAAATGVGFGAKAMKYGSKVLKTGGVALVADLALDYAGDKLEEAGHKKTGALAKVGATAAAGAGTGAMIGTALAPFSLGLSIPVATAIGGVAGAAYGTYENWNGLTGSPNQPLVSPDVNKEKMKADAAPGPGLTTNPMGDSTGITPESVNSKTQDPAIVLNQSVSQMNQTLISILQVLSTQTDEMVTGNDKNVYMQQRLQRAIKQNGFSADITPAAAVVS